jgi:hypothetical protein
MNTSNTLTIQFAAGGYVLVTSVDGLETRTEVFTSTAKLLKAVRGAVDSLSLVPRASKEADSEE